MFQLLKCEYLLFVLLLIMSVNLTSLGVKLLDKTICLYNILLFLDYKFSSYFSNRQIKWT